MKNQSFFKMYTNEIQNGIIGEIGQSEFCTLCVILAHTDGNGKARVSIRTIGEQLGVSRVTASGYVKKLLSICINGKPILTREKKNIPWESSFEYTVNALFTEKFDRVQTAVFKGQEQTLELIIS